MAFTLLPAAQALDLFVIVLLLVAAHGTYGLARRFDADRTGAVLAGIAFAGSGYIACQLKHLSIVSTVVWLPVGLLLIDRALGADTASGGKPTTLARRALFLAMFGLVFAEQVLSGFPQSAYICALCYGAFALFRAIGDRGRWDRFPYGWRSSRGSARPPRWGRPRVRSCSCRSRSSGSVSDRSEPLGYLWSTRPGLLAAEHPDVPRAVHQRRHLRQLLRRPAVLLGGLRLRRSGDVAAGALRRGARATAAWVVFAER